MIKLVKKTRERILVVDDDEPSRHVMSDTLSEARYLPSRKPPTVLKALGIAARHSPDLVVSDLAMPGIDGIELTRRLHVFARGLPVVLTTCPRGNARRRTAANAYGAPSLASRSPMSLDELIWTIDRASSSCPSLNRCGQRARRRSPPRRRELPVLLLLALRLRRGRRRGLVGLLVRLGTRGGRRRGLVGLGLPGRALGGRRGLLASASVFFSPSALRLVGRGAGALPASPMKTSGQRSFAVWNVRRVALVGDQAGLPQEGSKSLTSFSAGR